MAADDELREGFINPPAEYRTAPLWSANDDLDPDLLREQVREMRARGIGGFIFQARPGLVIPYLSDRWMECVRAAVEEARRHDMRVWLCDEESGPSGSAAGRVPEMGREHHAKSLHCHRESATLLTPPKDAIRVFRLEANHAEDVTGIVVETLRTRGGEYLVFHQAVAEDAARRTGAGYVDTLRPETARAFLESTHDLYRQRFAADFGRTILGIFTHEPHLPAADGVPWTERLPRAFREEKGYDLLERLPCLFLDIGDYRRVRYDYWDVVTHLFLESWCRPLYEWCEANGLALTGHFRGHVFPAPTATGSTMPLYACERVPGMECQANRYEERGPYGQMAHFGSIRSVKEAASVARQLGRPRVLSEVYGGSGWELTFADQKRIGDWHYALGANFLCQHLAHASLRGFRKRDYPPSFMPHAPWWGSYRLPGDYFARLSYVLSQGEPVADLLVLHPSGAHWCDFRPRSPGEAQPRSLSALAAMAQAFDALLKGLSSHHYDYDLGDDLLLRDLGRADGPDLVLGECRYRALIVPPHAVLRRSTLAVLRAFLEGGGRLIAMAPTPALLEGVPSEEVEALFADPRVCRIPAGEGWLPALVEALGPAPVSVRRAEEEATEVLCGHRRAGDTSVFFLVNMADAAGGEMSVRLPARGAVEEWDPVTGRVAPLAATEEGEGLALRLDFPPGGSHLLVVRPAGGSEPSRASSPADGADPACSARPLERWEVARTDHNVLVLDFCRCRIGGGEWSEPHSIRRAWEQVRRRYGLDPDHQNRREPVWRALERMKPLSGDTEVSLEFSFEVGFEPAGRLLLLALETPERFRLALNGREVAVAVAGWWRDRAFRTLDIAAAAQQGINTLTLTCPEFSEEIELETLYLLGDFRVEPRGAGFVLVPESPLPVGDWTARGYPFYAGSFIYTAEVECPAPAEGERVFVAVPEWQGSVLRIAANDGPPVAVGWPPYRADVTAQIRDGSNRIAVEVVGTLRNLLGPHHLATPSRGLTTPGTFYQPHNWSDGYDLVPYGLTGAAYLARAAPPRSRE
ncbi:MAG: hypothetical protein HY321_14840 [Armatimonadetes bacterium]|nr:hypothetical protein [Armatimonadota bacterium]